MKLYKKRKEKNLVKMKLLCQNVKNLFGQKTRQKANLMFLLRVILRPVIGPRQLRS